MNKEIAGQLIRLAEADLELREKLLKENKLDGYNPEMEAVHKENAEILKEIINIIGWPTISKVGDEASEAAWLIVQHSIGDPLFMKKCLALLEESAGDINPQNFAYLYDRVCYFEGRPQKYGTQFDDNGIYPVEDKNEVNVLRQNLNLKPHTADSITQSNGSEKPEGLHNDQDFNEWRKKTGWI